MKIRHVIAAAAATLAAHAGPSLADPVFPALTGPVVDGAHEFDDATKARLSKEIEDWRRKTGRQLQVVTVQDLGDYDVEDYVERLNRQWHIGAKDIDDGIVLIQAVKQHTIRAATGGGVQGEITDADAKEILHDVAAPLLRKGDAQGGITAGAEAIMAKATPVVADPRVAAKKAADAAAAHAKAMDLLLDALGAIGIALLGFASWLFATRKTRAARRAAEQAERQRVAAEAQRERGIREQAARDAAIAAQRKREDALAAMTPAARAAFLADEAAKAEEDRKTRLAEEARAEEQRRTSAARDDDAAPAGLGWAASSFGGGSGDDGSSQQVPAADPWSGGGGDLNGGGATETY